MIEETCGACLMARHFDCLSDRCRCCGDAPSTSFERAWSEFADTRRDAVEAFREATVDRWIDFVDRHFEFALATVVVLFAFIAVVAALAALGGVP